MEQKKQKREYHASRISASIMQPHHPAQSIDLNLNGYVTNSNGHQPGYSQPAASSAFPYHSHHSHTVQYQAVDPSGVMSNQQFSPTHPASIIPLNASNNIPVHLDQASQIQAVVPAGVVQNPQNQRTHPGSLTSPDESNNFPAYMAYVAQTYPNTVLNASTSAPKASIITQNHSIGPAGAMRTAQNLAAPPDFLTSSNTGNDDPAHLGSASHRHPSAAPSAMTTTPTASVRASGRKRATRACDPCHYQHAYCDGNGIPCQTCTRKGRLCIDTRPKGRTGPVPAQQGLAEAVLGLVLDGDSNLEDMVIDRLQMQARVGNTHIGLQYALDGKNRRSLRDLFASTRVAALLRGEQIDDDE
ncbi:hypothetical protein F4778DRAFT_296513 [Xylariomycetidae sp. FL2044]|nr:hypothetical protein F4778DRAFT_296513 [Xylariomycetidae sp. FL2044]